MGRTYVGYNVDTSQGNALAGFLQQVALTIGTPTHIGPVLKFVHSVLADDFVMHMSGQAAARPSSFHHVYEWNQIGNPNARLWKDVLKGGGATRTATFEWRASKSMVPVRDDFAEGGVKKIHIFVWKAPVMEYSQDVEITPKRGTRLAYFTGPTNPEDKYKMAFTLPGQSLNVRDPGGPQVKNAFTAEYVRWWSGSGAESAFKANVSKVLTANLHLLATSGMAALPIGNRARKRSFGLATLGDTEKAISAGKAAAKKKLNAQDHRYIELARARERFMQ